MALVTLSSASLTTIFPVTGGQQQQCQTTVSHKNIITAFSGRQIKSLQAGDGRITPRVQLVFYFRVFPPPFQTQHSEPGPPQEL